MTSAIALAAAGMFVATLQLAAQPDPRGEINILDEIFGTGARTVFADDGLDDDVDDDLDELAHHPLDLRTATADALEALPGITPEAARRIIWALDDDLPADFDALDSLANLSAAETAALRTFTRLDATAPRTSPAGPMISLRTRLRRGIEERRGYRDPVARIVPRRDAATGDSLGLDTIAIGTAYLGDAFGVMTRCRVRAPGVAVGVVLEKDPGEAFFATDTTALTYRSLEYVDSMHAHVSPSHRLGGFLSAYASLELDRIRITLGDFTAAFGQGLVFGAPFRGIADDNPVSAPWSNAGGIRVHGSSDETAFLRGAAITLRDDSTTGRGMRAAAFASQRRIDATLEPAVDAHGDTADVITALRGDGYRRTHSELRRSSNVVETLVGGNLRLRRREGSLGLTACASRFSHSFAPTAVAGVPGSGHAVAGIDGTWIAWQTTFFAEAAWCSGGGLAAHGGAIGRAGALRWALAARWFDPDFASPHGSAFMGAGSLPRNERGAYAAVTLQPAGWLRLAAHVDLFDLPDRTRLEPFPPAGTEGALRIDASPLNGLQITARLAGANAIDRFSLPDSLERDRLRLLRGGSVRARCDAEYHPPHSAWRVRARYEQATIWYESSLPSTRGTLLLGELRMTPSAVFTCGLRIAFFDADGADASMYVAEQDVPGYPVVARLGGRGRRLAAFLRWRPLPWLAAAAAYSQTAYTDRTTISPGSLDEIAGSTTSGLVVQVDVRWD